MSTFSASLKVNKKIKHAIDSDDKNKIIIDKIEEFPDKEIVKVNKKVILSDKNDAKIIKSGNRKGVKKTKDPSLETKDILESDNTNGNNGNSSNTNQDFSFILKKNKQSGNFSILQKSLKPGVAQKVKYTAYNVFLPFGKEEYNDNLILNAIISDSTNYNYNLITTLKRIIETFEGLCHMEQGKYKYSINDKKFFSYMKMIKQDENIDDDIPKNKLSDNQSTNNQRTDNQLIDEQFKEKNHTGKEIKKYQLRLYLRYGAKVTHATRVGELSYNQLKGKKCNLDLELGSMWVNNNTMMYGITIHVIHITVLN